MSGGNNVPRYIPLPTQPLRSVLKNSGTPTSSPKTSPMALRSTSPSTQYFPSSSSSLLKPVSKSSTMSLSPSGSTTNNASPTGNPITGSSPPIAGAGYTPKVSFDTFENPAASMFSFTLQVKSDGYSRTRNTRVFLCASSPDESGSQALDWALDALVQDGDELIVFRGVDPEDLDKDHEIVRDEARELMRFIQDKAAEYDPTRKLSIVVEFIAGKVTETLDRLIALYRPDSVVVGTKGQRGVMQTWGAAFGAPGMGSVSKYTLSHSPVPIIVVSPERKVRKVLEKRRADPKRGTHFDEVTRNRNGSIWSPPITPIQTRQ